MLEMIPCEASNSPSMVVLFFAWPLDDPGSSFSADIAPHGFPTVGKWPVFWGLLSCLLHHLSFRQSTHVLQVDGRTHQGRVVGPICLTVPLLSWWRVCSQLDANNQILPWECAWSGVWCAKFNFNISFGDCFDKECAALSWILRGC